VQYRKVRRPPGVAAASSSAPATGPDPPLTARSVLASTLLGVDPPELPVAALVRMARLFDVNENRARVALSRMVTSGEATTDGAGRYRLAGHLLERQRRQAASRAGRTLAWDGGWDVVVVTTTGSTAEVRARRRLALRRARLAELREGVWTRPANLDLRLERELADDVTVFAGASAPDPGALAGALWDLDGWATRATHLLGRLETTATAEPADLAPGFVLSAAVLRHLQGDPLLPDPLVGPHWPGARLRRVYDAWDARYRATLARWGGER
jgi:phenylacetic acid degradation operon negative regulatory protein